MAALLPNGKQFYEVAGIPLVGGKLYTWDAGTSNPRPTYSDAAATIPNTNPVILDARGEAVIFWSGAYKVQLQDALGNILWTVDGLSGISSSDLSSVTGAGLVGYTNGTGYPANSIGLWLNNLLLGVGSSFIGFIQAGLGAIVRTVLAKLREEVSADDFGADPTGVADSYAAITAAFVASPFVKLNKNGTYKTSAQIIIPQYGTLRGAGRGASSLTVTAQAAAVLVNAYSRLSSVQVRQSFGGHTSNLIEVGSLAINARCAQIDNVDVAGAGLDNIAVIHGNLGTIGNISSTSAVRDNLNFGATTVDANAWKSFGYIDLMLAGRDNLHISGGANLSDAFASRTHNLTFSAQNAVRYNAYVGSRSNLLTGYLELGGVADAFFDVYAQGNRLECSEDAVITDSAAVANSNLIYNGNMGAAYVRGFRSKAYGSGVSGKGFGLKNDDSTPGECYWEKRGTRNYVFAAATSGATAQTSFLNDTGGVFHQVGFQGDIFPITTNSFRCGVPTLAWSIGYTQTAFTVTSDRNAKTEERTLDEKELAVARALMKLPKVYKLKDSVAEKGSDGARWHSGYIAQDVAQCFTNQGLDPYNYAMNCKDMVMEGIGEPVLNEDGTPVIEVDELGNKFPMVDTVGKPKLDADGNPVYQLSLRYEELYAFRDAALVNLLEVQ